MKEKLKRIGLQILKYFLIVIGFAIILSSEVSQICKLLDPYQFDLPADRDNCQEFFHYFESPEQMKEFAETMAFDTVMPDTEIIESYIQKYDNDKYDTNYTIILDAPYLFAEIYSYSASQISTENYREATKGKTYERLSFGLRCSAREPDSASEDYVIGESITELDKLNRQQWYDVSLPDTECYEHVGLTEKGQFYRVSSSVDIGDYHYSAATRVYLSDEYVGTDEADAVIEEYQRELTELINSIVENAAEWSAQRNAAMDVHQAVTDIWYWLRDANRTFGKIFTM